MESSNIHQLQGQLVGSSSSAIPSCYGAGTTHAWTPNTILNANNFSSYPNNGGISNLRHPDEALPSTLNTSISQALGFDCANNTGSFSSQHSGGVKEELLDIYYPNKFTEMLNNQSSSFEDFRMHPAIYTRNEQDNSAVDDLSSKLLVRSLSSGNLMNGIQLSPRDIFSRSSSEKGFTQIFPTINVSEINQLNSRSLNMNLQALDLLTYSKFNPNFSPPHDQLGLFKDGLSHGLDHMQHLNLMQLNCPNKVPPLSNGRGGGKRTSTASEESKSLQTAQKKPRLVPRPSCPPFKVRKEKLGDRIAALQQLVAPFGKTDTASVLMEAIGYIKFLQNQVETLSVPYTKSSRNKTTRAAKGCPTEHENEELTRDLRSREPEAFDTEPECLLHRRRRNRKRLQRMEDDHPQVEQEVPQPPPYHNNGVVEDERHLKDYITRAFLRVHSAITRLEIQATIFEPRSIMFNQIRSFHGSPQKNSQIHLR